MATYATRGDLARSLFAALGIEPTSSGKFGDAGDLDAATSTLMDLGITNGVGSGQYGTAQQTTRGQAFTMIARALGLADANTTIEAATQALVNAGVVQGYGGDPSNLGINDPLQTEHLGLLIERLGPELARPTGNPDGATVGDMLIDRADDARDENRSREDPAYAAYLAQLGIRRGEIDDEIALRQELFSEDTRRRSESYGRATEQAMQGIGTDFENRGLFRSGARLGKEAERTQQIGYQQEAEQYAAQRELQSGLRALEGNRAEIDREAAMRRAQAEAQGIQTEIESA
jgi:hypothetical protein